MSVQDLKDSIKQVTNAASECAAEFRKANQIAESKGARVQKVLDGTGHGLDRQTAAQIGKAREAITSAMRAVEEAREAASAYADKL